MGDYIADLKNITKRFPGVVALRNMSMQIRPGDIHGLIGENGAGKSTLIKILTGVHEPDEGEIFISEKKTHFKNPIDSQMTGIACVYQEPSIAKLLSVTDNIFMGNTIKKNHSILLNYEYMHKKASEIMESLGQKIDPRKPCGTFGMGIQQMVEIARAIILDAKIIIMDEPTSSLGEKEVHQLMNTLRALKDRGITILFVSHKLEELFEICDCVTVMRDGEHIITERMEKMTNEKLIAAMVGRSLDNLFPKVVTKRGEEALRVEKLCSAGILSDISFSAYRGEVLAFSGLVGAGRTETFRAIFAADTFDSGDLYVSNKKVKINSPRDAINMGIAFLTEDRKGQGLVLSEPVSSNLILANLSKFTKNAIWLDSKEIQTTCNDNISKLQIKVPSIKEPVGKLSGGNQQKVVIGKWINTNAEIFVFDEPTRGIDVGAKVEVYNIINRLTEANKCVILISSELPEVLGMSDRVIVMRNGKIMAEINRDSSHFNQESIMKAAWGGNINE